MKIAVFNTKNYEKPLFHSMDKSHQWSLFPDILSSSTVEKAKGFEAISCFVTDCLNRDIIQQLAKEGVKLISLRSAGFDHVDLVAAKSAGITVTHVPKYSPEAIAEFTVALILVLNRKILQAYLQGLENNFSLDGLVGFNLYGKTVGLIGTGNIGTAFARIMHGFGCRLLAFDPEPNDQCRHLTVEYVALDDLLQQADIVSLHCSLNDQTKYLMNENTFGKMKKNAMLINTGRGALCDTQALIQALETGHLAYAGLDVYEKEHDLFFKDRSKEIIQDELFLKLRSLPQVLITPHQAFLTQEAIENIVKTTIDNIMAFERGHPINQIV